MAISKPGKALDTTSEAKIKAAARVVFHKKGFAATRTRDIAEEAGINLALLNYYFRSKEKLFDLIMQETMQEFFKSMALVFKDEKTSLETKILIIADRYIDLLTTEPDIPIFLLSELRTNPEKIAEQFNLRHIIMESIFLQQWKQAAANSKLPVNPLHFMINLMSLVMFPFVASPILKMLGELKEDQFTAMMLERKKLIPKWVKAMMSIT